MKRKGYRIEDMLIRVVILEEYQPVNYNLDLMRDVDVVFQKDCTCSRRFHIVWDRTGIFGGRKLNMTKKGRKRKRRISKRVVEKIFKM